ncbi:hypothetical protein GOHSU_35_00480 [Gordonia hirsuta DSM 44140 = NBRC 16056]|uniref:DUF3089 domain-containing protein n=1 Tax=Gordonia hirsuta DSM 44140 = NBRC 16056 TaxID=1121927 RepID=L7LDX7_9ACTN|nr:DUF3089 domain-containing protein [Gordonia hirsuta]GAC58253.1 hypothetical protein GOHSU_35_00480 [Gordonia hirsuta DSM 44140 = NBRC 16056]
MKLRRLAVVAAIAAVTAGLAVAVPAPAQAAVINGVDWLCHTEMKNDPCDLKNDRTDMLTGKKTPATPVADADKQIDCFYLYPTVTDNLGLHAPGHQVPATESIARFQAAPFNGQCRVFAPNYRQMTLFGLTPAAIAAMVGNHDLPAVAYGDVLRAWKSYLRNDNQGRGVVIIGHSQGTMMARKLIREQIDPDPQLRKRFVGGILMGGNVTTREGRTTGGDFRNIPVCTQRGQAGCVTAYSTELIGLPSLFGNSWLDALSIAMGLPMGPGFQVACTDPAKLSGITRPVGATTPSKPFADGIISLLMAYTTFPEALPSTSSTWTTGKGRYTSSCVNTAGFHRLRVHPVIPQQVNEIPLFDTHLLDVNFGVERLVKIVELQKQTHLATA